MRGDHPVFRKGEFTILVVELLTVALVIAVAVVKLFLQ